LLKKGVRRDIQIAQYSCQANPAAHQASKLAIPPRSNIVLAYRLLSRLENFNYEQEKPGLADHLRHPLSSWGFWL
jgi:hypothetical protein